MSKFFAAAILNLCLFHFAWAQSAPQEVKAQESKDSPLTQLQKMLPEGELPEAITTSRKIHRTSRKTSRTSTIQNIEGKRRRECARCGKAWSSTIQTRYEKDQKQEVRDLAEIVKLDLNQSTFRAQTKNGKGVRTIP